MTSKHLYFFCGLALIGMNVWSLTVVRDLYRQQAMQPPGMAIRSLPVLKQTEFRDGSRPMSDLGARQHLVLLYFFSPFDCPTAIEELEELEALHQEQPAIEVRAVALHASPDEARQTERNFHLSFKVIADTDAQMGPLMKPPQTPWKILFDATTLRVWMEDGPSIASEEKKAFHHRVAYLLRAARLEAEPHP
jgi:peroxiredoxin